MKLAALFCLILMALSGCRPPSAAGRQRSPSPGPPGCQEEGTVDILSMRSGEGGEYRYGLYLPPCYGEAAGTTYPIVYFIPGRTSAPETWFNAGLAQIADELIRTGELPPFIVVTTQNIDSSNEMDAHTIVDDLIPYVESRLPVSPLRRHHAVAGGSLGGIAAYRIGLNHPEHFASIGMFGSGAIHGEEPRIRAWLDQLTPEDTPRFFLNTGFEDPLMLERARAIMDLLDEFGVPHTHVFTPGRHSYSYWATHLPAYFHWVALDW